MSDWNNANREGSYAHNPVESRILEYNGKRFMS